MKKFVVTNPAAAPLYDLYAERINKARSAPPEQAAVEARWAAFDFAKEALTLMGGRASPAAKPAEPSAKTITPDQAKAFLVQAGGDKAKARELAKAAGFSF